MALSVSLAYTVVEEPGENSHVIKLLRPSDGFQLHQARGTTRELALQGLKDFGFTVVDA